MKSFLRGGRFSLVFCGILCTATLSIPAAAQNITQGAAHALSDWHSVQALPAQTRIRIATDKKKTSCFIDSVTDDHLACSSSSSKSVAQSEYSREEIKEVALLHRSRSHSTVVGAFLGLGIGAGVGAVIGMAIHLGSGAKSAGAGAALGATAGILAGAALGSAKDWSAGSTVVYRHP